MTQIKPTIAFIDDDERILRAMTLIFRDNYTVFTTTDPDAFLDYIRFNLVHVAISDQRMPVRLGVDILHEIKDISPFTMRILLTGYADLQAIIDSINKSEIFRYLIKPCKTEEIKATISQAAQIAQANFLQARTSTLPTPMENDDLHIMVGILNGMDKKPTTSINAALCKPFASEQNTPNLDNLLLIDSNIEIRDYFQQLFANRYNLLYAQTVEQAYEHLTQNTIGVCITDVMVAGEPIDPMIYNLKQNNPSLVIMVQTAFQDGATLIDLINKGQIFRCLPKPIRISLLEISITRAFEYHHKLRNNVAITQHHTVETIVVEATDSNLSPPLKKFMDKLRLKLQLLTIQADQKFYKD